VLGSNPSTTNFLAVWRWTLVDGGGGMSGVGSGLFWRWWMGGGGSGFLWRWTLAVGEVHGESILVLVFACFGRFCAKC